jgi:DNA-binding NarL/FixJ family response regulator
MPTSNTVLYVGSGLLAHAVSNTLTAAGFSVHSMCIEYLVPDPTKPPKPSSPDPYPSDALNSPVEASVAEHSAAIVDLELKSAFTMQALRALAARYPTLALTSTCAPTTIRAAFESGAMGCLSVEQSPEDFCGKVGLLLRGELVYDDHVAKALCLGPTSSFVPLTKRLSSRELDVLRLAADGFDVSASARKLHISPHTVRDALRQCYKKLAVHDRAAAVATGFRLGYLE